MAIVHAVESQNGERRRLRLNSPLTDEPIGEIAVSNEAEVREAVARARRAQPAWEALAFPERAAIMRRAIKILLRDQEEYIQVIRRETGRSRFETIMMEIFPACDSLEYWGKNAQKLLQDERPGMHLLRTKKLVITYRPLGVVGIITPWNGPFILALNPTVQALMAGNTVVLKPSEVTPFSGHLVRRLFDAAGLPADAFIVVDGDGEAGAALVNAGVNKIAFTGSVRTGRKIGEACGRNLIPCTLELGGKDPMIVCEDADLDRAARGCVFGAFLNAGQFCCSTERVYVVERVADEFISKVVACVSTLRQGIEGEYDIGPMIWPKQLEVVEQHVNDALAKGAKLLIGGRRNTTLGGLFYEPTVLTDVTHQMRVMREETFGPVLPIVRVQDEQEALRLANDSDYGLSSTLWTNDEEKALRLARLMESGSVCVNDSSVTYGALEAPFGGMKTSGLGNVHGASALKSYAAAKPVLMNRFRQKEEMVWYPYTREKSDTLQKVMRWVWGTRLGRLLS
ncbi:MAG TPA: aldehyde dehydrogenase family protein [Polyangiaceae bacterium]|nr:aldehyde dehydrogenase family protein [Polyangiaceae bacterium]